MEPLHRAQAFLESFHPVAPWALLTFAVWAGVYSVRRWLPNAWAWLEYWGPEGHRAAQVFQALPAILGGALAGVLLTGGTWADAWKGAAAGALAPLMHHAAKAYRGALGGGQ